MNLDEKYNLSFVGANGRKSLLNIFKPLKGDSLPLIVFMHGFKGYKDWGHFPLVMKTIAKSGFGVLSFNFSHNGGTVENPIDFPDLEAFSKNTYSKELEDIGLILDWIKQESSTYFERVDLNQIYLIGHSRGGGMAVIAADKFKEVKRVVTWSAVADFKSRLPDNAVLEEWKLKGKYFIRNGRTKQDMPMLYDFVEDLMEHESQFDIERAAKTLQIPQLIIHGELDETIKLSHANRLKSWNPNAQLDIIDNGNHTLGGKHPWDTEILPPATESAIHKTVEFLKS